MKPKMIRTEEEYQAALAYIETLMEAAPGSPEEEDLELYSLLVEHYEQEHFPIEMPEPVAAIKFRMDQLGLSRQDLTPYIGSQSKVSEVLNHKRPLSLAMIRALHEGLGIPAEVLLQEITAPVNETHPKPCDYPFAEMLKKGYFAGFSGSPQEARARKGELIGALTSKIRVCQVERALCRSSAQLVNPYALEAWQARALELAETLTAGEFDRSALTMATLRQIIHLSALSSGPLAAKDRLEKLGVVLVILPHLQHTYLDGACFMAPSGRPVIGLTLRHDRLDNFWFTLAHELAHLYLHLKDQKLAFFDDLDHAVTSECNHLEQEADQLASDLLIPQKVWVVERDGMISNPRETAVRSLADRLDIHPAIVAGRIRRETQNYTLFSSQIKVEKVKRLFIEAGVAA